MIYLSDGYLKIPVEDEDKEEKKKKAQRFFSLAAKLPMDLQMMLSNRVFGIMASVIRRGDSEAGFRKFAKGFSS